MRNQALVFDMIFKLNPTDSTVHAEDVCNRIFDF